MNPQTVLYQKIICSQNRGLARNCGGNFIKDFQLVKSKESCLMVPIKNRNQLGTQIIRYRK